MMNCFQIESHILSLDFGILSARSKTHAAQSYHLIELSCNEVAKKKPLTVSTQ